MTKIKLNNSKDFEELLIELKEEEDTELSFETEDAPNLYPCLAVFHYSKDLDYGSTFNIEFIYPSDFN